MEHLRPFRSLENHTMDIIIVTNLKKILTDAQLSKLTEKTTKIFYLMGNYY